VWCEVLFDSRIPIRIFKTRKAAFLSNVTVMCLQELPYADAVYMIRQQVFERSVKNGTCGGAHCEKCGAGLTWQTMEMHEAVTRGNGGEISLTNCYALCHECHQGRGGAHWNRRVRFGEKN